MERYSEYKDSGVKWLGEIPKGWGNSKLKYTGELICGGTPSTSNKDYWIGDIPWMQSGKVHFKHITIDDIDKYISKNALKESSTKMVRKNSTVLAITGATCSNIGFLTFNSTINQSVIGIENNMNYLSLYIYYFMVSQKKQILFHQSGGAQGGVNKQEVENLHIPKLPLKEQEQIVAFLDDKTAKIDDLLAKTTSKIALLKEKRTALINHCVTKGLNPNAPMKDSGVELIGEIPSGWKMIKLTYLTSIITCGHAATPEYVEKEIGVPFLSALNCRPFKMNLSKYKYIKKDLHEKLIKNRKPIKGDILITRVGAGIGQTCLVDIDFEFSIYVSLTHLRLNEKANGRYMIYFFNSDICQIMNNEGTVSAGGQGNLNVSNLEKHRVPTPSLFEQNEIAYYLDEQISKINTTISIEEKRIELLKEYRQSLISNVVTGKIKVCN